MGRLTTTAFRLATPSQASVIQLSFTVALLMVFAIPAPGDV
jgi:hypothetical protein